MTIDPLTDSYWYDVGQRTAIRLFSENPSQKHSAEIQANIKGLEGNPRFSFIAGFRLKMVKLTETMKL